MRHRGAINVRPVPRFVTIHPRRQHRRPRSNHNSVHKNGTMDTAQAEIGFVSPHDSLRRTQHTAVAPVSSKSARAHSQLGAQNGTTRTAQADIGFVSSHASPRRDQHTVGAPISSKSALVRRAPAPSPMQQIRAQKSTMGAARPQNRLRFIACITAPRSTQRRPRRRHSRPPINNPRRNTPQSRPTFSTSPDPQ